MHRKKQEPFRATLNVNIAAKIKGLGRLTASKVAPSLTLVFYPSIFWQDPVVCHLQQ